MIIIFAGKTVLEGGGGVLQMKAFAIFCTHSFLAHFMPLSSQFRKSLKLNREILDWEQTRILKI